MGELKTNLPLKNISIILKLSVLLGRKGARSCCPIWLTLVLRRKGEQSEAEHLRDGKKDKGKGGFYTILKLIIYQLFSKITTDSKREDFQCTITQTYPKQTGWKKRKQNGAKRYLLKARRQESSKTERREKTLPQVKLCQGQASSPLALGFRMSAEDTRNEDYHL